MMSCLLTDASPKFCSPHGLLSEIEEGIGIRSMMVRNIGRTELNIDHVEPSAAQGIAEVLVWILALGRPADVVPV